MCLQMPAVLAMVRAKDEAGHGQLGQMHICYVLYR